MTFAGLPVDGFDFYDDLEEVPSDACSAWFKTNKARYDASVAAPLKALGAELAVEFGETKVFRPYKDVRFSKDKRPVKDHAGMVVDGPVSAYYAQVGADGLLLAGGMYQPSKEQLERFRQRQDDELASRTFDDVLDALSSKGFGLMTDDALATAPRGWARDHPRIELLRLRRVTVSRMTVNDPVLHDARCLEHVRDGWRAVRLLNDWLDVNVGPG